MRDKYESPVLTKSGTPKHLTSTLQMLTSIENNHQTQTDQEDSLGHEIGKKK